MLADWSALHILFSSSLAPFLSFLLPLLVFWYAVLSSTYSGGFGFRRFERRWAKAGLQFEYIRVR